MVQTDIFVKVINTSVGGSTITACYPQDDMKEAVGLFNAIRDKFKETNSKRMNSDFDTADGEDYFSVTDKFSEFYFCVKVIEQPKLTQEFIVNELECDGFFD